MIYKLVYHKLINVKNMNPVTPFSLCLLLALAWKISPLSGTREKFCTLNLCILLPDANFTPETSPGDLRAKTLDIKIFYIFQ